MPGELEFRPATAMLAFWLGCILLGALVAFAHTAVMGADARPEVGLCAAAVVVLVLFGPTAFFSSRAAATSGEEPRLGQLGGFGRVYIAFVMVSAVFALLAGAGWAINRHVTAAPLRLALQWALWVVTYGLLALYAVLHVRSLRYLLGDRYLTKMSGILWRVSRLTPLDEITNVDVRQGPVERLLGFGQVWVFTPSTRAQTPETKLIGVADPHALKELILARAEACKASPLPHHGPPASAAGAFGEEAIPVLTAILETLRRIEAEAGSEM